MFLLKKLATKLPKCFDINEHGINLRPSKQPFFKLIYSLKPVKLRILKIFIEINLANGFIYLFKSLVRTFILFVQKPDSNCYIYINYYGYNNFINKN